MIVPRSAQYREAGHALGSIFALITMAVLLLWDRAGWGGNLSPAWILLVEHRLEKRPIEGLNHIDFRQAWWVGVAQCFSMFPGVSRSGATIIGGLLTGMDRSTATEFSFLLAVPTMLAATGYKIVKSHEMLLQGDPLLLPLGLAVSFFTGLAVVAGFLAYVRSHTFRPFAYYRIVLGLFILAIMR